MAGFYKIEINETAMIKRIIQIHDDLPRAWNSAHHVSQEYLDKLFERIQSDIKPNGFWILSRIEPYTPDSVDGVLWATLEDCLGALTCRINSFWIRPELRNQSFAPRLTEECLRWAKGLGANRLECSTHTDNSRMREILERHGFKRGMIQYSLCL